MRHSGVRTGFSVCMAEIRAWINVQRQSVGYSRAMQHTECPKARRIHLGE